MARRPIPVAPHLTLEQLRARERHEPRAVVRRRWQALRLRQQGTATCQVAEVLGVSPQTVTQWVMRYNREGPDGVLPRPKSGRRRRLSPTQREELRVLLRTPPPGAPAWTGRRLQEEIAWRYGVRLSKTPLFYLLHQLGFRRVQPRPRHPRADAAAQETFKKKRLPNG